MIKHIVMWKVCKDGTAADRKTVCTEFFRRTAFLQSIITEISNARVGFNLQDGDSFHICIDSTFQTMEDLQYYINHPEHLKVREYMNSVCYDKIVFDYYY